MKEITRHSPKNRYFADIHFTPALDFGSVISIGAEDIETLRNLAREEAARQINGKEIAARIRIRENIATYPAFNWREVEIFSI